MALKLITPPPIEPVTLSELKDHLRVDSGGIADALSVEQTILAGSHIVAPAYSLVGATVDVLGYSVLAILTAGTCGGGGTVDVKLRESATGGLPATWTDVAGGAFAPVTPANHEKTYELAYSGNKRYLRAVATVDGVPCEFGVSFILRAPISLEDTLLAGFITAAREYCEGYQNRAYITQTWDLMLDAFPDSVIQIPLPPLQVLGLTINYYDTANVAHLIAAADYQMDVDSYKGRICPVYGKVWPTAILRSMNGVVVQFIAGYGLLAANVPEAIRLAIKLLAGHLYEHREATDIKEVREVAFAVKALLGLDRVGAL